MPDSETGSAIVEFALVLPILLALMMGIITTGIAINHTISLNNAAREAGRYGATLPADDLSVWLETVATAAEAAAGGDLQDGVVGRTICVAFVTPGGGWPADKTTRLTVDHAGNKTLVVGETCYADGLPGDERRVQVVVGREVDLNFVFAQPTLPIDGRSTARFERAG